MKTFEYHSVKYGSPVQVTYNKNGIFTGFVVLSGEQIEKVNSQSKSMQNHFFEDDFLAEAKAHGLKYTEVERVVTFDMAWDKYRQKDCGRTKGEAAWNKLSKVDQVEAFDFIDGFKAIVKLNQTALPYFTTYINSKRWIR
jgi:hypothetical protein